MHRAISLALPNNLPKELCHICKSLSVYIQPDIQGRIFHRLNFRPENSCKVAPTSVAILPLIINKVIDWLAKFQHTRESSTV